MSVGDGGRRTVEMGGGGEFDLIRRFLADADALPPQVRVGPGDDAAVLEGGIVLSTDLSVEDVHFRRAWISHEEIGWRAAAAALSDLAAMGAAPLGLFLSLAAPGRNAGALEAVHRGAREAGRSVGAVVLGGDVSASPGPLVVDVTVLGRTDWPVLRTGACVGDELWVTGALGGAAAAVRAWQGGGEPSPALRRRFARPEPRVKEAQCLVERGVVRALIDLSDGLAGDAGHLAAASSVRVVVEAGLVPVDDAAEAAVGVEEALSLALYGGEDYELCFAAPPGEVDAREFEDRFELPVRRVGRVEEGEGVWLETDGGLTRLEGGFDHLDPAP